MRIELLWFEGCPNHEAARGAVERVLASRRIDASAIRLILVDEGSAESLKFPGSPTIRVDGRDIEPGFRDPGTYALSCRIYATSRGLGAQPDHTWIEEAIEQALSGSG
jgi:hypothetical protein